jgi:hypothetical protein
MDSQAAMAKKNVKYLFRSISFEFLLAKGTGPPQRPQRTASQGSSAETGMN